MAVTKFRIFKVEISDDGKFDFNQAAQKEVNSFLVDPNIVYTNHSTSILKVSKEEFGKIKNIDKYLIVTVFYKDLAETSMELSKVSKKTVSVIKKVIEKGDDIKMPSVETEFDKKSKAVLEKNKLFADLEGSVEKNKEKDQ